MSENYSVALKNKTILRQTAGCASYKEHLAMSENYSVALKNKTILRQTAGCASYKEHLAMSENYSVALKNKTILRQTAGCASYKEHLAMSENYSVALKKNNFETNCWVCLVQGAPCNEWKLLCGFKKKQFWDKLLGVPRTRSTLQWVKITLWLKKQTILRQTAGCASYKEHLAMSENYSVA